MSKQQIDSLLLEIDKTLIKLDKRKCKGENETYTDNIQKQMNSIDSFLVGALKELHDSSFVIQKKESKVLLKSLYISTDFDEAKDLATKFAKSLVADSDEYENIYDNQTVSNFFNNAPVYKFLFTDNCKNKTFKTIKNAIFADNSREQRIMYAVMNTSYFDNINDEESAINNINSDLTACGYDVLNEEKEFDSLIIQSIKEENRINIDNNLSLNIGGMRGLSKLINGKSLSPDLKK